MSSFIIFNMMRKHVKLWSKKKQTWSKWSKLRTYLAVMKKICYQRQLGIWTIDIYNILIQRWAKYNYCSSGPTSFPPITPNIVLQNPFLASSFPPSLFPLVLPEQLKKSFPRFLTSSFPPSLFLSILPSSLCKSSYLCKTFISLQKFFSDPDLVS